MRAVTGLCQSLLLAVCLPAAALAASPVPGTMIVNQATLADGNGNQYPANVSVEVVLPPSLEILRYVPAGTTQTDASGNPVTPTNYLVQPTECDGQTYSQPDYSHFASGNLGTLPATLPLINSNQFNVGEPLFLEVQDTAANVNPLAPDTVVVHLADVGTTGDQETVTLTETGANTGIFIGYINTISGPARSDCQLAVNTGDSIVATYGASTRAVAGLVDPLGRVFDDVTGALLSNVQVELEDTSGNAVAVQGDDGLPFPNPVITGSTFAEGGGSKLTYTFGPGEYRFPFVSAGGKYRLVVSKLPAGYIAPTAQPANLSTAYQNLPNAPFVIDANGSYGLPFSLSQGPITRVDIPADRPSTGLYVAKSAGVSTAAIGDFVPYLIQVNNTNSNLQTSFTGVVVTDHMPYGLRYRHNTLLINGVTAPDPQVSHDGSTLTIPLPGALAAGTQTTVTYATEVTAATPQGLLTNIAQAQSGALVSNVAQASITITNDLMNTHAILTGRVWDAASCDSTDKLPMANVRLYMEDGSYVITDQFGKWHIEDVAPGTHVVQLDKVTLPPGYQLLPCEKHTRSAGNSFSQFVDVQGGTVWQVDFYVHHDRPAPARPAAVAAAAPQSSGVRFDEVKEDVRLRLSSESIPGGLRFYLDLANAKTELNDTKISIQLPKSLAVVAGSWTLDGVPYPDFEFANEGGVRTVQLGKLPVKDGNHELSWETHMKPNVTSGSYNVAAEAEAKTPYGPIDISAENSYSVDVPARPGQVIVFHPHFATYSTVLAPTDKRFLDKQAKQLINEGELLLEVVGHTDNVRVVPRKGRLINDNYALSAARAQSVANYLSARLKLDESHILVEGKGPDQPIADNKTKAGKAMNRRVELKIHQLAHVEKPVLSITNGDSGEQARHVVHYVPVADDDSAPDATAGSGPADAVSDTVDAANAGTSGTGVAHAVANDLTGVAGSSTGSTGDDSGTPAAAATGAASGGAGGPAAAGTGTGTAAKAPAPAPDTTPGILSFKDGDVLADRVYPVRFRIDSRLKSILFLDGKPIDQDRIGFEKKEGKTTVIAYIGIDFGEQGPHTLELRGVDPFGIARFKQVLKLSRAGAIDGLRLVSASGNVADGKTPVIMRIQMQDSSGRAFTTATDLKIIDGTLQPLTTATLDKSLDSQGQKVSVTRDGIIKFAPVSHSGLYTVTLGYNNVTQKMSVYVRPEKRDWIMVGMAEGTLADKTLSGNIEGLQASGENKDISENGRVAFFAKGQIKGEWLLTLAYDTARDKSQAFGQVIDPTQYYTVYADSTSVGHDAASREKLYIRMEKDAFYALFGDFNTGLTDTTLSRYTRTMTGMKSEYHDEKYDVTGFAADSDQVFQRQDIRGDGTSGMYQLQPNILPNSESIHLETRDRLQPNVVLATQQLAAFSDYSIDYVTGQVFFRSPVMSQDNNFNPIFIVAEYELQSSGKPQINAGGRAAVKLLDGKAQVGVTLVHEGDGSDGGNLHGLDASLKVTTVDTVNMEVAQSKADTVASGEQSGDAQLLEWKRVQGPLNSRVFFNDEGSGFGLGQQPAATAGLRNYGADEHYQLNRFWTVYGDLLDTDNLETGATQRTADTGLAFKRDAYTVQAGVRTATNTFTDGTATQTADQLTASGTYDLVPNKLSLHADSEFGLKTSSNQDFPDQLLVGADYKLSKDLTLTGDQQMSWSKEEDTSSTRGGLRWSPWTGANFSESLDHDVDESGDRIMSSLGLGQSYKLTPEWTLSGTYDRSDRLDDHPTSVVLPQATPPYGPATDDFWATGLGASYQREFTKSTFRVEYRDSTTEQRWNVVGGAYHELDPQLAIAAGLQLTTADETDTGAKDDNADLRLSMAFRPDAARVVVLDRLDLIVQTDSGDGTDLEGRRIVNNINISQRFTRDQLSLQYDSKYVLDTVDTTNLTGYTDLTGIEWRHDLTDYWDVGVQTSVLHSWEPGVFSYSYGVSVGFTPVKNSWISIGYNFTGVSDEDFSGADYTAQGIYLKLRIKFDQDSLQQIWNSSRGVFQ